MTYPEEIGRYAVLVESLLKGDDGRGPVMVFRNDAGLFMTIDHAVKVPPDKAEWVHRLLLSSGIEVADEREIAKPRPVWAP